jgi:hypothetical protein
MGTHRLSFIECTLAAAFFPQRWMREPAGPIAFWHLCIERKKSLPFLIQEDGFLYPLLGSLRRCLINFAHVHPDQ